MDTNNTNTSSSTNTNSTTTSANTHNQLKQQLLVNQLINITGCNEQEAINLLVQSNWIFEVSICFVVHQSYYKENRIIYITRKSRYVYLGSVIINDQFFGSTKLLWNRSLKPLTISRSLSSM